MSPPKTKEEAIKEYGAESIKQVRANFDVIELSKKIKKKGDVLILSQELKIKPRILSSAIRESMVLSLFPNLDKSKASILSALRTDREIDLFSKKYNIYNAPARTLIKLVRAWNKEIQSNPFILISQEEHDLVIGSLLGDASIRQREKNSCFRFSHSIKQKDYAEFKKNLIREFSISEFREVKRNFKTHFIHAIDFSTKTHPIFNYYRTLFYKNNIKTITKEILNQINARSLAIWICDDGSYETKQGYIILCTNAYSLEEHELMKHFLKAKFELNPTIGFRDEKYYYLRFKQEDSRRLIEIIRPYIPECMKYKLGEIKNVC